METSAPMSIKNTKPVYRSRTSSLHFAEDIDWIASLCTLRNDKIIRFLRFLLKITLQLALVSIVA